MIATLAVDIGFLGIFGMYTDYFAARYRLVTAKVIYQFPDFDLWGLPGLFYVGPISLDIVSAVLFLIITRTRYDVSLRAYVVNPNLARIHMIITVSMFMIALLITVCLFIQSRLTFISC